MRSTHPTPMHTPSHAPSRAPLFSPSLWAATSDMLPDAPKSTPVTYKAFTPFKPQVATAMVRKLF